MVVKFTLKKKQKTLVPSSYLVLFLSHLSRTFKPSPSFFGHHCMKQLQRRLQLPAFGLFSHAHIRCLHILRRLPSSALLSEAVLRTAPRSGQDEQGVSRHVPKLKGKRSVEEHDEYTVEPLKDGRGMLQDEALLAEEDSTWRSTGQG